MKGADFLALEEGPKQTGYVQYRTHDARRSVFVTDTHDEHDDWPRHGDIFSVNFW